MSDPGNFESIHLSSDSETTLNLPGQNIRDQMKGKSIVGTFILWLVNPTLEFRRTADPDPRPSEHRTVHSKLLSPIERRLQRHKDQDPELTRGCPDRLTGVCLDKQCWYLINMTAIDHGEIISFIWKPVRESTVGVNMIRLVF